MPRTVPVTFVRPSMRQRIATALSALTSSLAAALAWPAWQPVPVRIRERPHEPGRPFR